MNEIREQDAPRAPELRSRFMTVSVEADANGNARIVMQGEAMLNSGFKPGETVEAIIQPGLISILRTD